VCVCAYIYEKNKRKALKVLHARLYDMETRKQQQERREATQEQVAIYIREREHTHTHTHAYIHTYTYIYLCLLVSLIIHVCVRVCEKCSINRSVQQIVLLVFAPIITCKIVSLIIG